MNFKVFSALFIIANALNALGDETENPLSTECMEEYKIYQPCVEDENIVSFVNKTDITKADVEKTCTAFESEKCKPFIEDISKTESACVATDPKQVKLTDLSQAMRNIHYKELYLLHCTKNADGKACPFTKYVNDHLDEYYKDSAALHKNSKKSIVSDCKDSKCNERMLTIGNLIENMKNLTDIFINTPDDKEGTKEADGSKSKRAEGSDNSKSTEGSDGSKGTEGADGSKDNKVSENNKNMEIFKLFMENYKEKKCDEIKKLEAFDNGVSVNVQAITFTSFVIMIAATFMLIM